ncbi:hypothetical protein ACIQAA_16505 [Neobacillus sp. NPDC093182]|uniref:hypothetical protein n=1 Tax=Neobacillus sp. NPDC093182 TaxID=3364297 RepID=UPI0038093380
MSVVIGYVSDYFSIVMTDTRITYGKNAEMGWNDNYEKLVSIPNMGWATGVGVFGFIDKFNRKLGKMEQTTIPIMEKLFKKTLEQEKHNHEFLKDFIDTTVITCSWVGIQEDKSKFRVGLFNKEHFGHRLVELGTHHITILFPYDYWKNLAGWKILK